MFKLLRPEKIPLGEDVSPTKKKEGDEERTKKAFKMPLSGLRAVNALKQEKGPQYNEDTSLKDLLRVLVIYSNIDDLELKEKLKPSSTQKKAANLMKSFVKTFDQMSTFMKFSGKDSKEDIEVSKELAKVNKDILFFLLNVTTEELHHLFMEFYSMFDKEKDYLLSKDDFEFIINYMGAPENIGKEKLNLSIKLILSKDNKFKAALDNLGRFFVSNSNDVVAPDILNDLFEDLKDEHNYNDKGHEREYFIDFIKFLPILMSYFLEYIKRRIEIRRENLMMIKGVSDGAVARELQHELNNEEEKKVASDLSPIKSASHSRKEEDSSALKPKPKEKKTSEKGLIKNKTSLLYRFESCGFNYDKQKNLKILSYRDIEKALILFRNSYNVLNFAWF